MAYGIETYRVDNATIISMQNRGVVFVELLELAVGNSGSKSYPSIPGGYLYVADVDNIYAHDVTVDTDASGNSRVNWTAINNNYTGPNLVLLFASKTVGSTGYGIELTNDNGEVLGHTGFASPQYEGSFTFLPASGYQTSSQGFRVYNHDDDQNQGGVTPGGPPLTTDADRILLFDIPDNGVDETWYSISGNISKAGTAVNANLTVYTKAASYKIPEVHVFRVNNPLVRSGSYGIQLQDASQKLTYDSSAENMAVTDLKTISYPLTMDQVSNYTIANPKGAKICVNNVGGYFSKGVTSGNTHTVTEGYRLVKRVGNQLSFALSGLRSYSYTSNTPPASYDNTKASNRPLLIVESNFRQVTYTGDGGGSNYVAPVITVQPTDKTVYDGQSTTFTVSVTGSPTYAWYKAGVLVATTASYTVTGNSTTFGQEVYCICTNPYGTVRTNSVKIVQAFYAKPTITENPTNHDVASGTVVRVTVRWSGPVTDVYWQNHVPGSGLWQAVTGVTTDLANGYSYFEFNAGDGATTYFQVRLTGPGGETWSSESYGVVKSWQKPIVYTQPVGGDVYPGDGFRFTVSAAPATYYIWRQYPQWTAVHEGASATEYWPPTGNVGSQAYFCEIWNGQSWIHTQVPTLNVVPRPSTYASYSQPTVYDYNTSRATMVAENNYFRDQYGNVQAYWGNGPGDPSLYDIHVEVVSGGVYTTGSSALNTWLPLPGGYVWRSLNYTLARQPRHYYTTLLYTIRHRASGQWVARGYIELDSENVYSNDQEM